MAVLFVKSFFPLILGFDFPIQIATLSIICFKGSKVVFPNKCVLQSLNIAFIIANSADPDEMQQTTKLPFQGFGYTKGLFSIIRCVNQQVMALGPKT